MGGYIEKQVAYLSGETVLFNLPVDSVSSTSVQVPLFDSHSMPLVPRGPWERLQRYHHPP